MKLLFLTIALLMQFLFSSGSQSAWAALPQVIDVAGTQAARETTADSRAAASNERMNVVANVNGSSSCSVFLRDDFAGPELDTGWTWIDPNADVQRNLSARPGHLQLYTNAPNNNNLVPGSMNGPRLIRSVPASFSFNLQASLSITPFHDYQGAGLVAFRDEGNFVRLERGAGITGQQIVFAVIISNVMTYAVVSAMSTNLELRLESTSITTTAYWRPSGSSTWQYIGSTDKLGAPSTAGLNLVAEFNSPPTKAEFDYIQFESCPDSQPNKVYLPLIRKKGETVIAGTLTNRGVPLPGTSIELRRYQPGANTPNELVVSTSTNADGLYRFVEPPAPPAGYVYYVRFRNTGTAASGLLFAFVGDDLAPIQAETTLTVPPIDLADISLGVPYDSQLIVEINTPIQFNWSPRNIAGDSYRFIMEDSQNPTPSFDSGALGAVGLYRLASRPAGFTTAPNYYVWYIAVDTAAGTGFSFNSGAVEFKN